MKPDTDPAVGRAHQPPGPDRIERAHLRDLGDQSHVMYRYPPDVEFDGFLQRFWVPVWSVPPGEEAPQRVLQYPVCLIVITAEYSRFYGVVSGLSTTVLAGNGWAVGVMLAPAAGFRLAKVPVAAYTDRSVDLTEILGRDGARLVERVRAAMAHDQHSVDGHQAAMAAYGDVLRPFLPVDHEGELVNRLVAYVETNSEVLRVAQLCEAFGLTERALQRLVHRRLGLTPKWLIQRRRLQEAAERLRDRATPLGDLAALLGYADQPHFIRDFSRVTSMTPGEFSRRFARGG